LAGMSSGDIDGRIIEILRRDSRESFVDIGRKVGLSESAVRRRVKNLVDGGRIRRFTIEMGDEDATRAVVLVSVDSTTDTSKVSARLTRLEGVRTVYEITGQYDIAAVMSAPNIASVNTSIDALRKIPGVTDTNTVIILRTVV